jgi:hypothetical protein
LCDSSLKARTGLILLPVFGRIEINFLLTEKAESETLLDVPEIREIK